MGNSLSSKKSKKKARKIFGNNQVAERLSNVKFDVRNETEALNNIKQPLENISTDDIWLKQDEGIPNKGLENLGKDDSDNKLVFKVTVLGTEEDAMFNSRNVKELINDYYTYAYYEEVLPISGKTSTCDTTTVFNPSLTANMNSRHVDDTTASLSSATANYCSDQSFRFESESNFKALGNDRNIILFEQLKLFDENGTNSESLYQQKTSCKDITVGDDSHDLHSSSSGSLVSNTLSVNSKDVLISQKMLDATDKPQCPKTSGKQYVRSNNSSLRVNEYSDAINVSEQGTSSRDSVDKVTNIMQERVELPDTKATLMCPATLFFKPNRSSFEEYEEFYSDPSCCDENEDILSESNLYWKDKTKNKHTLVDDLGIRTRAMGAHKDRIKKITEANKCSEFEEVVDVFENLILQNLNVLEILPSLSFLDSFTIDEIHAAEKRSRWEAVYCLLKKLKSNKSIGNWKLFVDALVEYGYDYIVKNLRGYSFVGHQYQEEYLKSLATKLNKMILPRNILPNLLAEDVISPLDKEEIERECENRGNIFGANLLLRRIPQKHSKWYTKFINVLRETGFDDAADDLYNPRLLKFGNTLQQDTLEVELFEKCENESPLLLESAPNSSGILNNSPEIDKCFESLEVYKKPLYKESEGYSSITNSKPTCPQQQNNDNANLRHLLECQNEENAILKEKMQLQWLVNESTKAGNTLRQHISELENEYDQITSNTN